MSEKFRTLSIATVTLLSATGLALAGGASKSSQQSESSPSMQQSGNSSSGMSGSSSGSTSTGMSSGSTSAATQGNVTKDKITLTNEQKRMVYQQLGMQADAQDAPAGFQASVGATLPSGVTLKEVPNNVSTQVPSVANYRFAKLEDDRLLIVDPNDRRVVSIIDEQDGQQQQGQKTQ